MRLAPLSLVISLCVVVVLPALGCVSLGKHEALEKEHAKTQAALKTTQQTLALREGELSAAQKHGQDLDAALASEKAHAEELQAQISKLQGDLAQLLKDKSALSSSVDQMKQALDELARRKAEADRRITEYRGLLSRFKSLIDAGKLKVKIVDGRMVVALASDILFPSGSASLSKDGKASISEVAAVLATIPDRKFQVEGHTDNVPIRTGQFPSNWELASARALNVLKTMIEGGLPPERVSAASFGDSKPTASNESADGKAQNRRIEIVVVPDLSTLPGFDELQKASS